jgi:protein subunit release factor B
MARMPASGIQTNCQRERFREKNRFLALRDLVEKLEVQRSGEERAGDKLGEKDRDQAIKI